MASKKKLPKPHTMPRTGKIPEAATTQIEKPGSTNALNPSFKFTNADENRWVLSSWTSAEIDDLIRALKKIEKHTWAQIQAQGSKTRGGSVGCGYKIIQNPPQLPAEISEDVTISEMRVCQKKRIFGFRIASVYYIVWFDRDHSVCPD